MPLLTKTVSTRLKISDFRSASRRDKTWPMAYKGAAIFVELQYLDLTGTRPSTHDLVRVWLRLSEVDRVWQYQHLSTECVHDVDERNINSISLHQ